MLIHLAEPVSTDRFGSALAHALPAGHQMVVYLLGDLGAGKTSLARALLRGLAVEGPIRSPTYTLIERYVLAGGSECAHIDLYRIADPEELDYLALDELASQPRLWLIEWPQRGAGRLPKPDLSIEMGVHGGGRTARLCPSSASGLEWVARLQFAG